MKCASVSLAITFVVIGSFGGCRKIEPASGPKVVEAGRGWRGNGTGNFRGATPPLNWSKGQNVLWRTPLPAPSNASPVVAGDRIFVCAEPDSLLCLEASTGRMLWQRTHRYLDTLAPEKAAEAEAAIRDAEATRVEMQKAELTERRLRTSLKSTPDDPESRARLAETEAKIAQLKQRMGPALDYRLPPTEVSVNGYTTPTPATDGQHVFVFFGNGVAASYDLAGNRRWARIMEKPTDEYGHSSSPLLAGGKLFLLINSLHALDTATGTTLWQTPAKRAWGSPVLLTLGGETSLLLPGGEIVRWSDGKVLTTKCPSITHSSPVVEDDAVYFIEAAAHALRLETPKRADRLKRKRLWDIRLPGDRYYASPVVAGGIVFALGQRGELTTIHAETGEVTFERTLELPGKVTFYPSIALAASHVFLTGDDGTTFVFTAEREPRLIAKNPLEPLRSSLLFEGTRIYIRTLEALWCLGE